MRYIIVGGSAAAISAVESIRSLDHESSIDLFSDEETPSFRESYSRTTLRRSFPNRCSISERRTF